MEYTVYLDALAIMICFLIGVHALILWAVGQILKLRTSVGRVVAGAAMGTICDCAALYLELFDPVPALRVVEVVLTLVSMMFACKLAFNRISRHILWRSLGYAYLLTIVSAGSSFAAYYMTGGNTLISKVIAVGSLLLTVEVGWGVIQNRIWPSQFMLDVDIGIDGTVAKVCALVDTGNTLKDPLTKSHVVVLEYEALRKYIPEDIRDVFMKEESSALNSIAELNTDTSWSSRVRIIPYSSLGRNDGILLGFKPDFVRVYGRHGAKTLTNMIVGVHPRRLSPQGDYQALIGPEVVEVVEAIAENG